MIGIVLFLVILLCVSSIFYPALRKLTLCLIGAAALTVGALWMLVEITNK